ncbi:unnamed protein product [Moneuplotes crassus]|uniref:Uncharacterized protein n=1 Tax=Euplotes crassus TaxID=5936 RepID=A0AAD2D6E8_EUPCR|nr:unnamed protein product [Moneuplotes crassus]|eukprot:CAMPEP_0196994628 /NCGR_PEP_ID=MMETSP1380-20130617/888_1 /TAXON_ID=5936 /ORGANISM="Euplotes crassus, Strain CT5" /LENGTH=165 /DNA_ID=CAMNT_0042410053 /DNA_START=23 /DNA_END=520 /DNA_ORIENTATION=+
MEYTLHNNQLVNSEQAEAGYTWVHYVNIFFLLGSTYQLFAVHPWNNPAEIIAGVMLAGSILFSAVHHLDSETAKNKDFQRWGNIVAAMQLGFFVVFALIFASTRENPAELLTNRIFMEYIVPTTMLPLTFLLIHGYGAQKPQQMVYVMPYNPNVGQPPKESSEMV